MKVTLLVIGKTTDPRVEGLVEEYRKRLLHTLPTEIRVIPELKNTKNLSQEEQKKKEGLLLLDALLPSDYVVLLDEHGREYRSIEFAQKVNSWQLAGQNLVFVVGGPYGFSGAVYERANEKVSISKMTFSHQMIRLLFVEQLYRAMTILGGEPYHHE